MLGEFFLAEAANAETVVEDDGAGRRGSLIDGEHVAGHGGPPNSSKAKDDLERKGSRRTGSPRSVLDRPDGPAS